MKVCEKSGYNYKPVPQIQLKGEWLRELGFEVGDYVCISCEDGRLVITRDEERAALVKAEKEFMERETKALQANLKRKSRNSGRSLWRKERGSSGTGSNEIEKISAS